MKITSTQFIKGIRGTDDILYNSMPQIAFVGRSNVGKSSLIAALMNNKGLVKVSNRPGKTTEINFFLVNGDRYFVDLPGYGFARVNPKEKEKLQKLIVWYLSGSKVKPQVVVLVVDAKVGLTAFDHQMIEILRHEEHSFIIAVNKIDKLKKAECAAQIKKITQEAMGGLVHPCSAIKKEGLDSLLHLINE